MSDLMNLPTERDLPPARADRMRRDLLRAAHGRPRRSYRRLVAVAAAAVTLVAGAALVHRVRDEPATQVLAMGPGELTTSLRRAADQCLDWLARHDGDPLDTGPQVPATMADLAVSARQGHRTGILFLNPTGYVACDYDDGGNETTGSFGAEVWPQRDWLPGPVQRLSLSSSDADGGAVSVLGRVSARVHRLVLEHGTGRTTEARLRNGAFGIVTRTADVRADAELVSYDAENQEIDRRPLFPAPGRPEPCFTGPAGTVLYGSAGPDCRPAEPWGR
ncbi:hypothetical protein AB0J80_33260 [Actinoplanes sp. NPDC049548]|uniref:hypothetical protein n=1 Tax=Actinoplanes sp. NPDC049548 TaxID=3155152 RepID=UPI0034235E76